MNVTPIQEFSYAENNLFIKREDLLPFSFGGNKARKAELFFKDIACKKSNYVVTYGSASSNHCRVVANMAAAKGLPCRIISPDGEQADTLNRKLMRLFGAEIITCPVTQVAATIEAQMTALRKQGHNPYFIQGGGHGNLGTQAYVQCFEELTAYEKENGCTFDFLFLASGTGTTQAGLVCGKLLAGAATQIIGISIARRNPYGRSVVVQSVMDYMETRCTQAACEEAVTFLDDYVLDGYGATSPEVLETVRQTILRYGIPLNTTYTGKAFWGMTQYITQHNIQNKNILFLHTGGAPLFFDDLGKLLL